jgi:3-methyladenine DNA glycosylase/8-oxoguanine DNA glycosylase
MAAQDALEYSKRWSPLRSYVTTYLFAAMRSGRLDAILGEA